MEQRESRRLNKPNTPVKSKSKGGEQGKEVKVRKDKEFHLGPEGRRERQRQKERERDEHDIS